MYLHIYLFTYLFIYLFMENIVPKRISHHNTSNQFQHSQTCTCLIATGSKSKIIGLQIEFWVEFQFQIPAFTMSFYNISTGQKCYRVYIFFKKMP